MAKLTTYRGTNPITNIESALENMFNLTPVFHNLEEVYFTGDTVRFSQGDDGLSQYKSTYQVVKKKILI